MPYLYRVKFEKNGGYRFIRDKKSIFVHAISLRSSAPGRKRVAAYDRHVNAYLDAVMPRATEGTKYAQALTQTDFPDVEFLNRFTNTYLTQHGSTSDKAPSNLALLSTTRQLQTSISKISAKAHRAFTWHQATINST